MLPCYPCKLNLSSIHCWLCMLHTYVANSLNHIHIAILYAAFTYVAIAITDNYVVSWFIDYSLYSLIWLATYH